MKILTYCHIIILFFLSSCSTQKKTDDKISSKINTKINKDYIASRKTFYGKLNEVEYKEIRKTIIAELKAVIPDKNSILINYHQHGNNCHEYGLEENSAKTQIDNIFRISARMSKNYNATDFFIYSTDYPIKKNVKIVKFLF